jgi:putative Mg2+ transporter-C (MgtC) family protein
MSALDVFIRIVIAAALGGVIGIEREIREHTAGFRTHILVSVGAAAFAIASAYGLEGTGFDPNRISAQIVTGIGFLGAGAIIRYGASVRGLTTAASLWAVAAVGLLAAQGFWQAAVITTGVVIFSLYLLRFVEDKLLYRLAGHPVQIRVQFKSAGYTPMAELMATLQEVHVTVKEMAVTPGEDDGNTVHLTLRLPRRQEPARLLAHIAELEGVRSVTLD